MNWKCREFKNISKWFHGLEPARTEHKCNWIGAEFNQRNWNHCTGFNPAQNWTKRECNRTLDWARTEFYHGIGQTLSPSFSLSLYIYRVVTINRHKKSFSLTHYKKTLSAWFFCITWKWYIYIYTGSTLYIYIYTGSSRSAWFFFVLNENDK